MPRLHGTPRVPEPILGPGDRRGTTGATRRRSGAPSGTEDSAMSGLRLLCGGKDRGLPPVARVDIVLGVLVVAVAVALVGRSRWGWWWHCSRCCASSAPRPGPWWR